MYWSWQFYHSNAMVFFGDTLDYHVLLSLYHSNTTVPGLLQLTESKSSKQLNTIQLKLKGITI